MRHAVIFIFSVFLLIYSCKTDKSVNSISRSINNEYSERFIIEPYDGYSKLTVLNPWQGAEEEYFDYYIADRLSALPAGVKKSKIILRNPQKIVCTSTTHISMLDTLGGINLIKAVSGSDFVYNKELRKAIDDGHVKDIGYENGYNTELIYSLDPDLVLVYGVGSESAHDFNRLADMGIPVVFIADYLESHPLARTEWIKVYGEFLDKKEQAGELFTSVRDEYNAVLEKISGVRPDGPRVLLGLPFKDKWFVSPGNSYISRLIEDAGGRYLWADKRSDEAIPMSLEAVCLEAMKADIWLNPGNARSINNIRMLDHRLADLPVSSEGYVFNNIKRINARGGNDYWESGTVNPHILLKDIASILHPGLFPDYELFYYTELRNEE
jgi:iron complex transport system substrate-binding protein